MHVSYLKAKIHRAAVTDANLDYEGSITIGRELIEAAGLQSFEKVDIYNVTNGERFHTYVIPGAAGTICLNGAAAWKAKRGDLVIIASYCWLDEAEARTHKPRLVFVGEGNRIKWVSQGDEP
jgi:aspartate 1-decarboxylase